MSIAEKALEALRRGSPHDDGNETKPSLKEVSPRFSPLGRGKKGGPPVKIYSRLFNEEIYIVADREEMETLVSKGVKEVVYMAWEIPVLKGVDKERLRAVHLTKKVFPGAAMA
jgi:hypothetical protein